MQFLGNRIFPKKNGKFSVPSIWEHPLPGPNSVPAFGTGFFPSCFSSGNIQEFPNASQITVNHFNFDARQDFPVCYQFVLGSPEYVYIPDFSWIFPSNGTRKKQSCPGPDNLGIVLQVGLVSSRLKRARERRPLPYVDVAIKTEKNVYQNVALMG